MNLPPAVIDNFVQLALVISVIGGVLIAIIVPTLAIYFHHKRQQLWHETARLALEKGQPVPPAPVSSDAYENTPPPGVRFEDWQAAKRAESRAHAVKGGLVLIAVGVGLITFFSAMGSKNFGMIGAIPGFIGAALLLHASLQPAPRSSKNPTKDS